MSLYQQQMTCHVLIGESCMEKKTEADSNDTTECPNDDKPTVGMLALFYSITCDIDCIVFVRIS